MSKKIFLFTLVSCAVLGIVAAAQERFRVEADRYVVEGKNLSKFSCVRGFLNAAFANYCSGETNFNAFLDKLGMEPDTPPSRIVTRAMFLDQALQTEVQDMRPYVNADPVTYERVRYDWLRDQVPRLRIIYDAMIADLIKLGVSEEVIGRFIDQEVRPTITMFSIDEPPTKDLEIMDLFEKPEVRKEVE